MEQSDTNAVVGRPPPPDAAELLVDLHRKVDLLSQQVGLLTQRQLAFDELKQDLAPVVNDLYQIAVEELSQVDREFTLDGVIYLLRKLLRNTSALTELMDQITSLRGLLDDLRPLGKQMHYALIERLDGMERKGTFAFVREVGRIGDRVLESFTPEDVQRLGDNIVHILNTIKSATQPDLLRIVNNTLAVIRQGEPVQPVGLVGVLKATRDPEVRLGLGVLIQILKVIAQSTRGDQPPGIAAEPVTHLLEEK